MRKPIKQIGRRSANSFEIRSVVCGLAVVALPTATGIIIADAAPGTCDAASAANVSAWRLAAARPGDTIFSTTSGGGTRELGLYIPDTNNKIESDVASAPAGLVVGPKGDIFIMDTVNRRVQIFTHEGAHRFSTNPILDNLSYLSVADDGRFFTVSGPSRTTVTAFTAEGKPRWQVDANGVLAGVCALPTGYVSLVYVDSSSASTLSKNVAATASESNIETRPVLLDAKGHVTHDAAIDNLFAAPVIVCVKGNNIYRLVRQYNQKNSKGVTEITGATIKVAQLQTIGSPFEERTINIDISTDQVKAVINNFRSLLLGGDGTFYLVGGDPQFSAAVVAVYDRNGHLKDTVTIPDDPFGNVGNVAVDDKGYIYSLQYHSDKSKNNKILLVSYPSSLASRLSPTAK